MTTHTHTLYTETRNGMLLAVVLYPRGGPGISVQPLTETEADVYVAGGCPALAQRLGLALPKPEATA